VLFDKIASAYRMLFEIYIYILALEMASHRTSTVPIVSAHFRSLFSDRLASTSTAVCFRSFVARFSVYGSVWYSSKKGSPYSITERRVPELIPVLDSQPAGDVNHKPDGRMPLLSARPAVTPATLKRAATSFAAW